MALVTGQQLSVERMLGTARKTMGRINCAVRQLLKDAVNSLPTREIAQKEQPRQCQNTEGVRSAASRIFANVVVQNGPKSN